MNKTIESNIQQIEDLASQLVNQHPELISAIDSNVALGRISQPDSESGSITEVSVLPDNTVDSIDVGFTVAERGPKRGRPVHRALKLAGGILSMEYGTSKVYDGIELYKLGEGFQPGIGEKRQKAAIAYTQIMLRQLEDQFPN